MISRVAVVLATALPLILLIFILLVAIAVLRSYHRRDVDERARSYDLSLKTAHEKHIKKLQDFAGLPRAWNTEPLKVGSPLDSFGNSYSNLVCMVGNFIMDWISHENADIQHNEKESLERIIDMLFSVPPVYHHDKINQDNRVFPNPHNYTPAEIIDLLKDGADRYFILRHIMTAVLLRAVSLGGNCHSSLLLFNGEVILQIARLYDTIVKMDLPDNMMINIGRYGHHYARIPDKMAMPYTTKAALTKLFQSLLEPYFTPISDESVIKRSKELELVMDTAEDFGMRLLTYPAVLYEFRWGERHGDKTMRFPEFVAVPYKGQKAGEGDVLVKSE